MGDFCVAITRGWGGAYVSAFCKHLMPVVYLPMNIDEGCCVRVQFAYLRAGATPAPRAQPNLSHPPSRPCVRARRLVLKNLEMQRGYKECHPITRLARQSSESSSRAASIATPSPQCPRPPPAPQGLRWDDASNPASLEDSTLGYSGRSSSRRSSTPSTKPGGGRELRYDEVLHHAPRKGWPPLSPPITNQGTQLQQRTGRGQRARGSPSSPSSES